MKILMISDVYFPRVNGVSTSIMTFRNALEKLGHETWLIAPDYGMPSMSETNIIRIESRYLFVDPEDRMMKRSRIFDMLNELRSTGFDLIHIQTPFVAHYAGIKLARLLNIPSVVTYHTFFQEYLFHYVPFLPKSLMRAMARKFSRQQCNQVDAVVVPSTAMKEVLTGYGVTVPMSIIPTGLELEKFQPGSRERFCGTHNIDPHRPILVHVGRVAFEKNIDFLLEVVGRVCTEIPEVLMIVAGEGPARKNLEAKAETLGLQHNTRFVNYLPRGPELWDCFSAGDLFVFASSTETQGLVLLEAMALGVPVVSTAVLGTRDIVMAQQGALVAEEDIYDFAEKVISVLSDEALRRRMSREGLDFARSWSTEATARRMIEFYHDIITD